MILFVVVLSQYTRVTDDRQIDRRHPMRQKTQLQRLVLLKTKTVISCSLSYWVTVSNLVSSVDRRVKLMVLWCCMCICLWVCCDCVVLFQQKDRKLLLTTARRKRSATSIMCLLLPVCFKTEPAERCMLQITVCMRLCN